MIRRYFLTLIGILLLGGVVGTLASAEAQTVETVVEVFPGTHSTSNSILNCGWHGVCGTIPTAGRGLDWKNDKDDDVWWRSRTYRSDSSWPIWAAFAVTSSSTASCHIATVQLLDAFAVGRGTTDYIHTDLSSANFDLNGRWSWTTNLQHIGTTADHVVEQNKGCQTTGPHIHHETGTDMGIFHSNYDDADEEHGKPEWNEPRGNAWLLGNRIAQAGWTW